MRYTAAEMVGEARQRGLAATVRQVRDWTDLGLLDHPKVRGRGQGLGVEATWPEEQLGLFLRLVEMRKEMTRIAPLCNVPVWTWLYFGERWVSLAQVRVALRTWEGLTDTVSLKAARRTARQLFDIDGSRVRWGDKGWLLDEVATLLAYSPRGLDEGEKALLEAVHKLVDLGASGLVPTLDGMALTPEAYVELLKARIRGCGALRTDGLEDSLLHWARYAALRSRAGYQSYIANFGTAEAKTGLTIPSIQALVRSSCLTVVTLLGLGLERLGETENLSHDHPEVWRSQNLRSIIHSQPAGDGVQILVDAKPAAELEAETANQ